LEWASLVDQPGTISFRKCQLEIDTRLTVLKTLAERKKKNQDYEEFFTYLTKELNLKKGVMVKNMTRYNDLIDTAGYWLCQKATCVKFCRKPFMMTFPNGFADQTKVSCNSGDDGVARWTGNQFAQCKTCQALSTRQFQSENLEIDCKVKRDVVYRQECLASCLNGKRLAISGSKRSIRHDPDSTGQILRCQCDDEWCTSLGWYSWSDGPGGNVPKGNKIDESTIRCID